MRQPRLNKIVDKQLKLVFDYPRYVALFAAEQRTAEEEAFLIQYREDLRTKKAALLQTLNNIFSDAESAATKMCTSKHGVHEGAWSEISGLKKLAERLENIYGSRDLQHIKLELEAVQQNQHLHWLLALQNLNQRRYANNDAIKKQTENLMDLNDQIAAGLITKDHAHAQSITCRKTIERLENHRVTIKESKNYLLNTDPTYINANNWQQFISKTLQTFKARLDKLEARANKSPDEQTASKALLYDQLCHLLNTVSTGRVHPQLFLKQLSQLKVTSQALQHTGFIRKKVGRFNYETDQTLSKMQVGFFASRTAHDTKMLYEQAAALVQQISPAA